MRGERRAMGGVAVSDGGRQPVVRVGVHVDSEFLARVLSADRLVLTSIAQRLVTDIVQTPTHSCVLC